MHRKNPCSPSHLILYHVPFSFAAVAVAALPAANSSRELPDSRYHHHRRLNLGATGGRATETRALLLLLLLPPIQGGGGRRRRGVAGGEGALLPSFLRPFFQGILPPPLEALHRRRRRRNVFLYPSVLSRSPALRRWRRTYSASSLLFSFILFFGGAFSFGYSFGYLSWQL